MLNKNSSTFRIVYAPVILSEPDRRRREGAVEGSRYVSFAMQHQGVLTKHLLNSVTSFAVQFQISLARSSRQAIPHAPQQRLYFLPEPHGQRSFLPIFMAR